MSNPTILELNRAEEAIQLDVKSALSDCTLPSSISPIEDYFTYTSALIARFVKPEFSSDNEALSLLVLGVVSAAEFYFRSILVRTLSICPISMTYGTKAEVSIGALGYYGANIQALGFSLFEHKSLANSAEIKKELKRLIGLEVPQHSSVETALSGFDVLCELRHSAVHARGFVGFKNTSSLGGNGLIPQRINVTQQIVFDLTKLSHNAIRSFNRFLLEKVLQRWIAQKYLCGKWKQDKQKFEKIFHTFSMSSEHTFGNDPKKAYLKILPAITARMQSNQ